MKKLLIGGVLSCLGGAAFAAAVVVGDGETYEAKDAASVTTLASADSITVAAGGVIDYTDADDELVLACPVSGEGTIKATSGKKILVLGDNSGFLGDWQIVSPVVVSNRYGLGCSESKGAFFQSGSTKDSLKFGGNGLTNDVPITLAVAVSPLLRKMDETTGELVLNGLVTHKAASTFYTPNATYAGGIKETSGSLTLNIYNGADNNYGAKVNGAWMRIVEKPIQEGAGNLGFGGANNAILNVLFSATGSVANQTSISRCHFYCGAANVVPKQGEGTLNNIVLGGPYTTTQWRTAIFDLNGFDQAVLNVYCNWTPAEGDGENYRSEVTSPSEATLTVSPTGRKTTATKYTGAVSLVYAGTGTNTFAHLLSTTTGRLTVKTGGAVGFKWNAGWQGPVTVEGGARLIVNSACAFMGGTSDIDVAEGGVIELSDGAAFEVKSLTLGDFEVPSGTYTVAGMAAAGYGAYVTGAGRVTVAGDVEPITGTHPKDGLIYEMVLPNETAEGVRATADDVLDGATWSAATPYRAYGFSVFNDATGEARVGVPDPIAVKSFDIREPYYHNLNVTNTYRALVFPKNQRTYDKGDGTLVTNVYPQGVLYTTAPKLRGKDMTVHVKLRFGGNYVQPVACAWDQTFFHLYNTTKSANVLQLTLESMNPTTAGLTPYLRIDVGKAGLHILNYGTHVNADGWADFFAVIKARDDGTSDICAFTSKDDVITRTSVFNVAGQIDLAATDAGALCLGNQYSQISGDSGAGNHKWTASWDSGTLGGFAGEIAQLEVYDHAMTMADVNALLTPPGAGLAAKIGSRNNSADEFAAEVDVADPFNPTTMPTRQMRKALTVEHPSVTIKVPLPPEENRTTKVLDLSLIRDDILGPAPVSVRVGGQEVGSYDYAVNGTKGFVLPKQAMVRDADGCVSVTITRTAPVNGTLLIDAAEISGSWTAGVADKTANDGCFTGIGSYYETSIYLDNRYSAVGGVLGRPWLLSTIHGWRKDMCEGGQPKPGQTPYNPSQKVVFWVSPETLAQGDMIFEFGSAGNNSLIELDVTLNGTPLDHIGPGVQKGDRYSYVLHPDQLEEGFNTVVISNVGANFADSTASNSYNDFYFDFLRFKVSQPKTGALLIVR